MRRILVHRRGYRRKDGTYVSPTDYYMKDTGKPGRTPKSKRWFEPTEKLEYKGEGWHSDSSEASRHRVLNGLSRSRGWNTLIKQLNAIRNVSTSSKLKRSATVDIKWMQRQRDK